MRTGITRELAKTHGFHIVAVDKSIPGTTISFEAVRGQIAERLKAGVEAKALPQYVSTIAGQAEIVGVELEATHTPLVHEAPTRSQAFPLRWLAQKKS